MLLIFTVVLTISAAHSITYASTANDRPPWTEQSSFVLGDTLYAIGTASNAQTSEAGRQAAFINGLEEIRNYGQLSDLDGLMIETQRTYEQP